MEGVRQPHNNLAAHLQRTSLNPPAVAAPNHIVTRYLTGRLAKLSIGADYAPFEVTIETTKLLLADEIEATVKQCLPIVRETQRAERRKTFYNIPLLACEQATN